MKSAALLLAFAGSLTIAPTTPAQTSYDAPVLYDSDRLTPEFHRSRRAALLDAIPENGVAVILGAPHRDRSNDVDFEYRQNNDLYYLTGTHEPGSALILTGTPIEVDGRMTREVLFVPQRDASREVWTGRLFGTDRAAMQLGINSVATLDRFEDIVGNALEGRKLYHTSFPNGVPEGSELASQIQTLENHSRIMSAGVRTLGFVRSDQQYERMKEVIAGQMASAPEADRHIYEAFTSSASLPDWQEWYAENVESEFADGTTLRSTLVGLRMIKTDDELRLMQRAIDITAAAHREAFRSIEPGMYEYEIEALVEYVFRKNGAEYTGFPSIIGSGENSVILHYETNRKQMDAEDMVVMDIGAEYHGYSADITRTVPVNGVFSEEQRLIYELVLRSQEAGIEASRAGTDFRDVHNASRAVLEEGMMELGLISDPSELRRFFMHSTSHYLGLDVHDVGTRGPLEPGTVITVEPGIYIAAADDIDPKWWNIGVRIEDDVLITSGDPVVMSVGAPRTVAEIESLMAERGLGNEAVGR